MFNWLKKIFSTVEQVSAGAMGHVEAPYKIESPQPAVAKTAPVRHAPNKAQPKKASTGKRPAGPHAGDLRKAPAKKANKPKSA
jgi:hypothetical protein